MVPGQSGMTRLGCGGVGNRPTMAFQ
jgi:hypothetical protein